MTNSGRVAARGSSPPILAPWWKDPAAWGAAVAALLGCAWFLLAEHKVAGQWGFSLDDSWIYATFARNLATGHGYSFNPGEQVGGATGPMYVLILAALYAIFQSVVLPAKIFGILCLAASSVLVARSVRIVDPRASMKPLAAGLLTAISPSLLWGSVSGMEIPLYLLAICLGMHAYVKGQWTRAALWWAIGVWIRPDGLLLAALGIVARPGFTLKNSVRPLAVVASLVAAYAVFNLVIGGELLPNSVGLKAHPSVEAPALAVRAILHWAGLWGAPFGGNLLGEHALILLPAIAAGAISSFRKYPAFGLYILGLPIAFGLVGAPWSAQGRYIMYVVPFGIFLAVLGIDHVTRRVSNARPTAVWAIILAACMLWHIYQARLKGITHGWCVQNINEMHRFMAERVAKITDPEDTVAVNDVGAMGYFGNCHVVDLVGLVSPRLSFPENLKAHSPKFLVIFPDWYAAYGGRDPAIDNLVFYDSDSIYKWSPAVGVGLTRNTIAPRNTMVLFERLRPEEQGATDVPVYWH